MSLLFLLNSTAEPLHIPQVSQSADAGDVVHLFSIDLTDFSGPTYYFTSSAFQEEPIFYQGTLYTPIDFEATGFEWNGRGSLPTPHIRVANTTMAVGAAVIEFSDLLGATVTRTRTFRRFLDGQPDADPHAHYPLDIYRVERKVTHNKRFIEWELSAAMDQAGRMIPGRQCLRDACTHRYRVFDPATGDFNYTKATCPYTGTALFTVLGQSTVNKNEDVCGKKLSDCRKRFETNQLPFRGFPGLAMTRVPS